MGCFWVKEDEGSKHGSIALLAQQPAPEIALQRPLVHVAHAVDHYFITERYMDQEEIEPLYHGETVWGPAVLISARQFPNVVQLFCNSGGDPHLRTILLFTRPCHDIAEIATSFPQPALAFSRVRSVRSASGGFQYRSNGCCLRAIVSVLPSTIRIFGDANRRPFGYCGTPRISRSQHLRSDSRADMESD